jgi:hypothetical protein
MRADEDPEIWESVKISASSVQSGGDWTPIEVIDGCAEIQFGTLQVTGSHWIQFDFRDKRVCVIGYARTAGMTLRGKPAQISPLVLEAALERDLWKGIDTQWNPIWDWNIPKYSAKPVGPVRVIPFRTTARKEDQQSRLGLVQFELFGRVNGIHSSAQQSEIEWLGNQIWPPPTPRFSALVETKNPGVGDSSALPGQRSAS